MNGEKEGTAKNIGKTNPPANKSRVGGREGGMKGEGQSFGSCRWGTCREDADMGRELGALDCGLVELNKPLGLTNEVQEAGGTGCPTSMGGVSAEVISLAAINI